MRRLSVGVLVVVALLGSAAIVFLRSRPAVTTSTDAPSPASSAASATAADQRGVPQTSEELIAAALQAGQITYEQSLLVRAYAMYDDPRLPKEFRSPVIDWEAGMALGIEIDDKQTTLSNEILEQLAPFRARPNDPISIFNRPRDEVIKAQNRPATGWVHTLVPGTNVRIWIKGRESQLDRFVPMVADVWDLLPIYFTYPNKDDGSRASEINPDTAVDVYFVNGGDIDPRSDDCAQPNPNRCILEGHGLTRSTTPKGPHASSAYCIVNSRHPDNEVMETIAHELAHAAQAKYDYRELETKESRWLREGSASWVAHHVMKRLKPQRRPTLAYDSLENNLGEEGFRQTGIFQNLHNSLDEPFHWYGTWLFFFYASMELGDDVVRKIWEADAMTNLDGIDAVNAVVPLAHHFPRFAVRNWNDDPLTRRYRNEDDTFPRALLPSKINKITTPPKIQELEAAKEPLPHLASAYFHFKFPSTVRRVTFENLFNDLDDAHIWAIPKIGTWRDPEEWSGDLIKTFCRDFIDQDLEELVLVVSNSHLRNALPPGHPKPRVLSESNGCPHLRGWAETTLHVKDAGQDATYASGRVSLRFMPRVNQDQPGNVQYDLMPTSVTWTASGRKGDCTLSGGATMSLGGPLPMPSNGSGYMNVVGLDGGDFHSIVIIAAPRAPIKRTCPGPRVMDDYVPAGVLLQILSEPNRVEAGTAVYKGKQTFDFGNPASLIPRADATWVMPPFLPGATGSDLSKALEAARSATPTQSIVYTFTWELSPINGALPPAGPGPLAK